jgi:hypothetical protein
MDGRTEFLVHIGVALATIAALLTGEIWYASYLDVAVVQAQDLDAPLDPKLEAVRRQEQAKLAGGVVPIVQAMAAIAKSGRAASPKLAAQPSDDLSPMSGWAHTRGFKAYEPRAPQAPAEPPGELEVTDGGVPAEGEEAALEAPPPRKNAVGVAKPEKPLVVKKVAPAPAAAPQNP